MPIQMPSNMLGTQRGPLDPAGAMARGDEMNLRKQSIQRGQQQGVLNQQNIDKGFREAKADQKIAEAEKVMPFLRGLATIAVAYKNTKEKKGKAAADAEVDELYQNLLQQEYKPPGTPTTYNHKKAVMLIGGASKIEKTLARGSRESMATQKLDQPVLSGPGTQLLNRQTGEVMNTTPFRAGSTQGRRGTVDAGGAGDVTGDNIIQAGTQAAKEYHEQGKSPERIVATLQTIGFQPDQIRMILGDYNIPMPRQAPGTTSAMLPPAR